MTPDEIKEAAKKGEIPLPGGWLLKRDDYKGKYHLEWFLCMPESDNSIWSAHFWDGKQAGASDCIAFANSLYNGSGE